jgi:hypothetical protein
VKTRLRAAGLIAIAAVATATFSYGVHLRGELKSKAEWSILQSADFNHRESSDTSNVFLTSDASYHLAGIINSRQKPILSPRPKVDRIWILLDSKYPPFVKILGMEGDDFTISRMEFDKIMAFTPVNPDVATVLSRHIKSREL